MVKDIVLVFLLVAILEKLILRYWKSIETDSADLNQKERFAMEVERLKEV